MKAPFSVSATAFILAMSAVAYAHAAADDGGSVVFQATRADRLYGSDFIGDTGLAVGEAGRIMRTQDGGKTWKEELSPSSLSLFSVAGNGSRDIAVGQQGLVVVRTADGAWRQIDSGADSRLLKVDVNSNNLAVAVGAFGTLLRSTDGGESWTSIAPEWAPLYDSGSGDTALLRDEPTNYVVKVFDDGRIIIGGEYGQLMESTDAGDSWHVLYRHPEENGDVAPTLFDITFEGERGYAVGQAGLVLRSDDAGRTWRSMPTSTEASLFAVATIGQDKVFAVGQRTAMFSVTGGASWEASNALDFSLNWYADVGHGASTGDQLAVFGHSARIVAITPFR